MMASNTANGTSTTGMQVLNVASAALADTTQPRWYLVYAANLASSQRKVTPLDKKLVIVDGLTLVFSNPGIPYVAPRFANASFLTSANHQPLMGVALLLSPLDFKAILQSEGGGTSYQALLTPAAVLTVDGVRTQEALEVITLQTFETRQDVGYPSGRYMRLIREGAKGECNSGSLFLAPLTSLSVENALQKDYITYLDTLPSYHPRSFRQKLGFAVYAYVWVIPIWLFYYFIASRTSKMGTETPAPIRYLRIALFAIMWWSYDWFGKFVFGDGEMTT